MDVSWCMTCNRHLDDPDALYCSRECSDVDHIRSHPRARRSKRESPYDGDGSTSSSYELPPSLRPPPRTEVLAGSKLFCIMHWRQRVGTGFDDEDFDVAPSTASLHDIGVKASVGSRAPFSIAPPTLAPPTLSDDNLRLLDDELAAPSLTIDDGASAMLDSVSICTGATNAVITPVQDSRFPSSKSQPPTMLRGITRRVRSWVAPRPHPLDRDIRPAPTFSLDIDEKVASSIRSAAIPTARPDRRPRIPSSYQDDRSRAIWISPSSPDANLARSPDDWNPHRGRRLSRAQS